MQFATHKLRSPLKIHGGKSYLARQFIGLFPDHETYVEPFAGGLSTLLNKPRVSREVAGDLDADLISFWDVLRWEPDEFTRRVKLLEYDQKTFETARDMLASDQDLCVPIDRAVQFLVANRMSRGGLGKDFAWSDRLRGGQPGDLNAWQTFLEELPIICQRVVNVEFHCGDALDLIRECDGSGVIFYCDPPYLHETRTYTNAYYYEMTKMEHAQLLSLVVKLEGKVFLSGYPSFLYDQALVGWRCHEFEIANHSGQGEVKERRLECIWEKPG